MNSHAASCISKNIRVPTLQTRLTRHVCHSLFSCPLQIMNMGQHKIPPVTFIHLKFSPLATSSPRLLACVVCNIATYRQFILDLINFHIVRTAYNHYVMRITGSIDRNFDLNSAESAPSFPKCRQTYLLRFPRVARVHFHDESTKILRAFSDTTFLSVLILWIGNRR